MIQMRFLHRVLLGCCFAFIIVLNACSSSNSPAALPSPTIHPSPTAHPSTSPTNIPFGSLIDLTADKAITIDIIDSPPGAPCKPACFAVPDSQHAGHMFLSPNVRVKVGATITWVNKSVTPHTVTASQYENALIPAREIFDSGFEPFIQPNGTFTYTVTMAAYTFHTDHAVVYYCQIDPDMVGKLTIVL